MTTSILVGLVVVPGVVSQVRRTEKIAERRKHLRGDVAGRLANVKVDVVHVYSVGELATHNRPKHRDLAECLVDVQSTGKLTTSKSLEFEAEGCTGMFVERLADVPCHVHITENAHAT